MTDFKEGYFVQFSGCISSIFALADGIAKLSNSQEVAYDHLYSVKTGDPLDRQITLVCDNIRYPAGILISITKTVVFRNVRLSKMIRKKILRQYFFTNF